MRAQKQLCKHAPAEGSFGDCYRTAWAALLNADAEDVPHVFDGRSSEDGHIAMDKFLLARGFRRIVIVYSGTPPFPDLLEFVSRVNPNLPFIVTGQSIPGLNHSVVCMNGKIVCDPSPAEVGLTAPCHDDGNWWIEFAGAVV